MYYPSLCTDNGCVVKRGNNRFVTDDGSHETFFPKPEEGQSLISFLSSQDFHTCAELDKVQYMYL